MVVSGILPMAAVCGSLITYCSSVVCVAVCLVRAIPAGCYIDPHSINLPIFSLYIFSHLPLGSSYLHNKPPSRDGTLGLCFAVG